MKKIICVIGLLIVSLNMFAYLASEEDIKEYARMLQEEAGSMANVSVENGRTIVFNMSYMDKSEVDAMNKKSVLESFGEEAMPFYLLNGISFKYILNYYWNGKTRTKTIMINNLEFLGYNTSFTKNKSYKNHAKAMGVNVEFVPPVGWEEREAKGSHIVKNFVYKTTSFMIQIKRAAKSISKTEAELIFEGDGEWAEAKEGILSEYVQDGLKIKSHNPTNVCGYPALFIQGEMTASRLDYTITFDVFVWLLFYDDKIVFFQGMEMCDSEQERKYKKEVFKHMVSQVYFPAQFY